MLSYQYVPAFFWWFTPVLAGLILSIPVSMLSSSIALGRQARELGLFLTPEETDPPAVLRYLEENLEEDEPVLPVLREKPAQPLRSGADRPLRQRPALCRCCRSASRQASVAGTIWRDWFINWRKRGRTA
ncbi:MAG: hypothetical protein MZV65_47630 [Chromatiales bacterium]|nr:hypothetical protein [Chromatiales bacterium]